MKSTFTFLIFILIFFLSGSIYIADAGHGCTCQGVTEPQTCSGPGECYGNQPSPSCGGSNIACHKECNVDIDGNWWCGGGGCVADDPSCTVSLPGALPDATIRVGETIVLSVSATATHGTMSSDYTYGISPAVATLTDLGASVRVQGTALAPAPGATLTVSGSVNGGCSKTANCSNNSARIIVTAPPWFQSIEGSLFARDNIRSIIPPSCVAPGCIPSLITNGTGGFPAPAIFGTSISTWTGTVSPTSWQAQTVYAGQTYDYAYFDAIKPATVNPNQLPTSFISGSEFTICAPSNCQTLQGFDWYKANGNLNITGDTTIPPNKKVVLFVDGDLTFFDAGRIKLANNTSSFVAIVSGDIRVLAGVTEISPAPALQGMFISTGQFITDSAGIDTQFRLKGSVIAQGGLSLQRDLGNPTNETTPAEVFEFDPALLLNFPEPLSNRKIIWKERAS